MKHWRRLIKAYKNSVITYSIILLLLIAFILFFLDLIKELVVICLFIALNTFLRFYKRVFPGIPLELEVVIFGSMLTTIGFGFWAGVVVAILSPIIGEFMNQQISPYSLVNVMCYILVPIITIILKGAILSDPNLIASFGITISIILNVIIFLIFILLGYDHFKNAAYGISNVLFNYLVFKYLAVFILKLIMI
jgi:hypothetical protein